MPVIIIARPTSKKMYVIKVSILRDIVNFKFKQKFHLICKNKKPIEMF